MTALNLTPKDTNYLTCELINQQLTQNKEPLGARPNVSLSTFPDTPYIYTDGTGRGQLSGQVFITASPIANMPLCTLPLKYSVPRDYHFPISVLRAGAYVQNAIHINALSSPVLVSIVNAPDVGDLINLDSCPFLLNPYN